MDLSEQQGALPFRHPWETARVSFFAKVLKRARLLDSAKKILDVGAGDAWFAEQLAPQLPKGSELLCWDNGYGETALQSPAGIQRTREKPQELFDVVLMMDVLEHIENDRHFLKSIVKDNLKSGGYSLVSVPAWPALFSEHDRVLHHLRRYRPHKAKQLLEGSGLHIRRSGGLFHSLMVPRALQKGISKMIPGRHNPRTVGIWDHGKFFTKMVELALRTDTIGSQVFSALGLNVPGLSWWALCQKV